MAAILDPDSEPRPIEVPSTLARGRYAVSRQAVLGVLLVALVALALLGARTFLAHRDAAPEPVAAVGESAGEESAGAVAESGDRAPFADGAGAGAAGPSGDPAAQASPSADVTVHVVGQVESPGIVTLPAGSRVAEAIESAGGTSGDADLAGVNLARVIADGEQILVPAPGEAPAPEAAARGGPSGPGGTSGPGALVNLNTADLATLETLPGVGPVLAQRILDWRAEHDRFTTVDELGEVSGVGEKTFAQLAPKVTV